MGRVIKRRYQMLAAVVSGLIGLGAASPTQGSVCTDCPPPGPAGSSHQIELFTDSITPTEQTFDGQEVFSLGALRPPEGFQPPCPVRGAVFEGKLFPPAPIREDSAWAEGKWWPPSPCTPGEWEFVGQFIGGADQIPSGSAEFVGHPINEQDTSQRTP